MKPTTQAYAELQTAYDFFNMTLFDGILPPCLLTLQREKKTMGYFSSKRFINTADNHEMVDEIALNPLFFHVNPPDALPHQETMQTIVHEMCHLWQFHFGTPGRGRYHNREWGQKMEEVGLMPSATGKPGGKKTGDCVADYAIEGGRFLAACARLLQGDFRISWRDRLADFMAQGQAGHGGSSASPLAISSDVLFAPKPQTRTKFVCPGCGASAWGKPSLNLMCGDCDLSFEPA